MVISKSNRKNPYDWINPLNDPDLFAGRREELATMEEQLSRLAGAKPIIPMVAIIGERRVGKTSVLRRTQGICQQHGIKSVSASVSNVMVADPWEFWHEVFSQLILAARDAGIRVPPDTEQHMGFSTRTTEASSRAALGEIHDLWFPPAYAARQSVAPADYIIAHDLTAFIEACVQAGHQGLVLILDEAHLLGSAQGIKQQIRHAVQETDRCGVVFAGEPQLGRMFTAADEPFFGQARVVPLKNFTNPDDVAECALLPLSDDERRLMSPMTVDYLARLSQGKPNQIRLICYSICNRYLKGQQTDLNITIDVLDDVIEVVQEAFQEAELRNLVDIVRRLVSVELELLYNMTRYPNWSKGDVVNLDESFRGEERSDLAVARRERCLEDRRAHFVTLGLMVDDPDRYMLAGGEFLHLYLRFLHEVRKYGKLSRRIVLGKGPPTPFGEKTEKLVRSLAYSLGERPEVGRYIFHTYYRDEGDVVETVRRRFSVLNQLVKGEHPDVQDLITVIAECMEVCELIGKAGIYYLLCLSVRNLESPRELMQIELYFDSEEMRTIDLVSLFNIVNQQAYDAKVLVAGYDGFLVELPDLSGFLSTLGVPSLDGLLSQLDTVEQWRLASVQHLVHTAEQEKEKETSDQDKDFDEARWIDLYGKGGEEEAEKLLNRKLEETQEREKLARLYNDRGYIRYGTNLRNSALARKDLETALHLHYFHVPLTLLNLSCIDIDEKQYEAAIRKVEDALLLTSGREQIEASYLRLRLPESHLNFRVNWEQHPANILEAAYINLAYATLKSKSYEEALGTLQEGMKLLPSSWRLKHALARLYLFRKRADWAYPIYSELSTKSPLDEGLTLELKVFSRRLKREKVK